MVLLAQKRTAVTPALPACAPVSSFPDHPLSTSPSCKFSQTHLLFYLILRHLRSTRMTSTQVQELEPPKAPDPASMNAIDREEFPFPTLERGLSREEVSERLARFGFNEVAVKKENFALTERLDSSTPLVFINPSPLLGPDFLTSSNYQITVLRTINYAAKGSLLFIEIFSQCGGSWSTRSCSCHPIQSFQYTPQRLHAYYEVVKKIWRQLPQSRDAARHA